MARQTKQDGGPAFPTPDFPDDLGYLPAKGMTLRDYFAASALQGILASGGKGVASANLAPGAVNLAFSFADMMLNERI